MFEKLFEQSKILETSLQATQFKNKVILNNISNVDTPNYKSKTVEFESILEKAINEGKRTGKNQMHTVMQEISVIPKNNSTTLDGNSNDIETEMINFYKNSIKYDVIVNSILSNSNIINNVYNTFK